MRAFCTMVFCQNPNSVGPSLLHLVMSLVMLVFIIVLWAKGVIGVDSYLTGHNLKGTSGAAGAWMDLLALVPISVTLTIGFLSFLIASIRLKSSQKILVE